MSINLSVPRGAVDFQLKPRITVIGIGGAGGNAVNNMIAKSLEGVDFIVANTDAQSLAQSHTDRRIQLGVHTTEGLGAGARPEIGRAAAEEVLETIQSELTGSHMAFITAGMGGGTGTGAAPVIARAAREMGILTVGVVTKPFHFEGVHRMRLAEAGMEELARYVDTLIIIPNQNLFRVANERTTFSQAFNMADDVLYAGVRGVTDLIMMPGLINLDFADIRTVMSEMGKAMMGTGEAEGEKRALDAAEAAISNPLLDDTSMKGARGVLINITGGPDMTLYEVDEAANRIRDEVDSDANIIFGSTFDERLEGKVRVSVVATGIDSEAGVQLRPNGAEGVSVCEQRVSQIPYMIHGVGEAQTYTASTSGISVLTNLDSRSETAGEYVPHDHDSTTQDESLITVEEQKIGESQLPELEQLNPEHLTMVVAERQISSCQSQARHNDAFIPAPAMEAKDVGMTHTTSSGSVRSSSNQLNPRSASAGGRLSSMDIPPQLSTTARSITPSQSQGVLVSESPVRRRPRTLLEKVAGIGRVRHLVEPPKVEGRETVTRTSVVDSPTLKVGSENRPVSPTEEDLDIPAFLRRQAN